MIECLTKTIPSSKSECLFFLSLLIASSSSLSSSSSLNKAADCLFFFFTLVSSSSSAQNKIKKSVRTAKQKSKEKYKKFFANIFWGEKVKHITIAIHLFMESNDGPANNYRINFVRKYVRKSR